VKAGDLVRLLGKGCPAGQISPSRPAGWRDLVGLVIETKYDIPSPMWDDPDHTIDRIEVLFSNGSLGEYSTRELAPMESEHESR